MYVPDGEALTNMYDTNIVQNDIRVILGALGPHPEAGPRVRRTSAARLDMTPQRLALSPAEVAEALGVSRAYVYKLFGQGRLRAVKIGRRSLVPVDELHRLLNLDAGDTTDDGDAP